MAITRKGVGATASGFNTGITPVAPAFAAGDTLCLFSGIFFGSTTIADPSGWTRKTPNVNCKSMAVWCLYSLTGAETIPTLNWGNVTAWAKVIVLTGGDSGLADGGAGLDRLSNNTRDILGAVSAYTPNQDGCYVAFVGARNKTSTSNATVYSAPTNFTKVSSDVPGGTTFSTIWAEWIQSTATQVAATPDAVGTVADATAQTFQAALFSLAPAAAATVAPPEPPMRHGGIGVQMAM